MAAPARLPNILITGTPGTGKTTTAEAVAAALGLTHVDVGKAIREQELHSGWDDKFECHIVDEDKARSANAAATNACIWRGAQQRCVMLLRVGGVWSGGAVAARRARRSRGAAP
jgi:adenylate kinase family enzyme